jgi:hypothetical protein
VSSPNVWPSAFALLGPDIVAQAGNYMSGSVFFVDSTSANASDANAGTEPEQPKATWTSAYTAASAGDLILCQPGHSEVISAGNTLSKIDIMTVGLGLGTLRPRFTSNVAGVMWTITGARTNFFSCYFPASTAATTARIAVTTGTEFYLFDSYFEIGTNDTTNTVTIAANDAQIEDSFFVATGSRPARAVNLTGATSGFFMDGCVFDGGAFGWTSHAFDVNGVMTGGLIHDIQLLNRSDFYITTSGCTYKAFGVRPMDQTGCRVVLAA